jgi:hypothetical protein
MSRIVLSVMASLVALASTTAACAQLLVSSTASMPRPGRDTAAVPQERHGFFISATVNRIDRQTGIVQLGTEAGAFSVLVSLDATQTLHEGEVIPVYVEDDEPPTLPL